ncbi:MAG: UDP-N-acetylmuramate dehydrogenase [Acidimicrobiales bacterium]|nr:UDP-N-acetylmuramate dehydrogenase [Acidimicrobiales bacterium]
MSERIAALDASLGDLLQRDVLLGPLTTYRVGGPARRFVLVDGEDSLRRVAEAVAGSGVDVLVVGKGSNLLVADRGFDGLAIQLGPSFAEITIEDETVRAGGAASLPVVARQTAAAALTGFEWAVGVPGSIGGAVRMNAGGHGSDMSANLVRVRVVDLAGGEDGEVPAASLDLAYRSSCLTASQVVVRADLRLERGDRVDSEAQISEIVRWRRANQPGGQNAGSVFTNPAGDSAGRLVDAAGVKGMRIGTAEVSPKHANFIQADDGGSADDVRNLMEAVAARVWDVHGVDLHPETRMVGFPPWPGRGDPTEGSNG